MGTGQSSVRKTLVVLRVNDNSKCFPDLSPFVHAITKYNSTPIESEDDILKMTSQKQLDLEILDLRNSNTKTITISTPLGIGVKLGEPRLLTMKVLEIEKGSPASNGLLVGDFVIGIENFYFATNDEFSYTVYRNKGKDLVFIVYRDCKVRRVPISLGTTEPFLGTLFGEGILMLPDADGDVINVGTYANANDFVQKHGIVLEKTIPSSLEEGLCEKEPLNQDNSGLRDAIKPENKDEKPQSDSILLDESQVLEPEKSVMHHKSPEPREGLSIGALLDVESKDFGSVIDDMRTTEIPEDPGIPPDNGSARSSYVRDVGRVDSCLSEDIESSLGDLSLLNKQSTDTSCISVSNKDLDGNSKEVGNRGDKGSPDGVFRALEPSNTIEEILEPQQSSADILPDSEPPLVEHEAYEKKEKIQDDGAECVSVVCEYSSTDKMKLLETLKESFIDNKSTKSSD